MVLFEICKRESTFAATVQNTPAAIRTSFQNGRSVDRVEHRAVFSALQARPVLTHGAVEILVQNIDN
jgi:hypothetical protein